MAKINVTPSGRAVTFGEDELIVSKTDLTGRITYANDIFLKVAGYDLKDVIGSPHSMIRHPDMPRSVFKLLWDTIGAKREIFAYVVNMAKNGDHYWVFAHVTPSLDATGNVVGYHSNRRLPDPQKVATVAALYADLRREEQRPDNRKTGMETAFQKLVDLLKEKGVSYDQFVFSI